MRRYGGIQWCPWCRQCAQDNNIGWHFAPSAENLMLDVLTCGVCGGTSEWLWGMGFHFLRPLKHPASGTAARSDATGTGAAEGNGPTGEAGDAQPLGKAGQ